MERCGDHAANRWTPVLCLKIPGSARAKMAIPEDKVLQELTTYREPIYRYVLSMARDAAEAEDLTQETFLRAHAKLSTLDDRARLSPWSPPYP